MRVGRWSEAEALLMRAGTIACEDAAFYNLVGVLWEVKGDQAGARRFYGKAIRADGDYAPAQQNMRRLYELWTFGRTREAVTLGDESAEIR
jgi:Flp pilus assembly protein TadD